LIGAKHPQKNGKLERFSGEYKRYRHAFSSFEEFIEWYKNRPHGSLEFERFETLERAFRRKIA
jgi:putative transposase